MSGQPTQDVSWGLSVMMDGTEGMPVLFADSLGTIPLFKQLVSCLERDNYEDLFIYVIFHARLFYFIFL